MPPVARRFAGTGATTSPARSGTTRSIDGSDGAVVPGSSPPTPGAPVPPPVGDGDGRPAPVPGVAAPSSRSQRVPTISLAGRRAAASRATGSVSVVVEPAVGGVPRPGGPKVTPSPASDGSTGMTGTNGPRPALAMTSRLVSPAL